MRNELLDILIKLSPTLTGIKPAELLNLKLDKQLDECKNIIDNFPQIKYIEIKKLQKNPRMQVIFFHQELLVKTLTKKVNHDFLVELGYPEKFNLETYCKILITRLKTPNFPHEIGVFLGYPLKDVLGYMGLYPLQLVTIRGWRYYGSEKLSRDYYDEIKKCRKKFAKTAKDFFENI